MEITKTYASYEEINRELQILKVEKDLAYEKMHLSFSETKDSFTAKNIVGTVPGIALNIIGALSGPLKNVGIARRALTARWAPFSAGVLTPLAGFGRPAHV